MLITASNIEELLPMILTEKPSLSIKSAVKYKHPKKTNNKEIDTIFGRVLFNLMLPQDYPFINEPINRKKLQEILLDISEKYDEKTFKETVKKIQKYSMLLLTIIPATIEVSKLRLPPELQKKKDELTELADNMDPVEFNKKIDDLYVELKNYLKKENVTFFDMIESGTKGKKSDLQQLFIAWGPAYQPLSNEMPIVKHSLLEGLHPEELYYGANKARFAAYIKSINVAPIGYLARKMRWALADVKTSKLEDCKTTKYFEVKVTDKLSKTIIGRYYYDDKNGLMLITKDNIKDLIGKIIKLRSPLYCKAKDGICKICLGRLAEQIQTEELGLTLSGVLYNILLNRGMKLSHHKLSSQDEVNFIEDIKKFY